MSKKIRANIYHHTHWDNEWYFTEEDSLVQFSFHMKELLAAFEKNKVDYFYLDGQTAIMEDYIYLHPEDKDKIKKLVSNKKLFIGPFNTQLDSFITSGESVINNLRYGINYGNQLGKSSMVAYLPDSFGQSQDFPKIFNKLGIRAFVFRRGMGDEHKLPLDFLYRSNDGSEVVTSTLYCGYGFATEPFVEGTLVSGAGLDYDGKDIQQQMEKLAELSTLKDEFLLPIGNDQTPVIWDFKEKLANYQETSSKYDFLEVTLEEYMEKLIQNRPSLKSYEGEFLNPQYHRVHRSIYSARMDIKIVQDKVERLLALEIQPMLTILDSIGLEYDNKLVDRIWGLLARSQTHSAATNTDKTNDLILSRSEKALNLAEALKTYLSRKVAISNKIKKSSITIFNTLPKNRTILSEVDIYTRKPFFNLIYDEKELVYQIKTQVKQYSGNITTNIELYSENEEYFKTTVIFEMLDVPEFSYQTVYIDEFDSRTDKMALTIQKTEKFIENDFYTVAVDDQGIHLKVKETEEEIPNFIYLEESGDEGDNYDYSYPTYDMVNIDKFKNITCEIKEGMFESELILSGSLWTPADLESRKSKLLNSSSEYYIHIKLNKNSPIIDVSGTISNEAKNHRVRLVSRTNSRNRNAMAGTQFGEVLRKKETELLDIWKEEKWLEEPSPIYPMLNFVSIEEEESKYVVYTKSSKEYEVLENSKSEIAITLFRAVGYLGLPDLNRRPGRASGLAEKLIPSPKSQMLWENDFHVGISVVSQKNYTNIIDDYNNFAVETIAYQKQDLNRTVTPISFFETNPLQFDIPDSYSISIEEYPLAFSTLEKINNKRLVRYYNNSGKEITLLKPIDKLNFFGKKLELSYKIGIGEIVTFEI